MYVSNDSVKGLSLLFSYTYLPVMCLTFIPEWIVSSKSWFWYGRDIWSTEARPARDAAPWQLRSSDHQSNSGATLTFWPGAREARDGGQRGNNNGGWCHMFCQFLVRKMEKLSSLGSWLTIYYNWALHFINMKQINMCVFLLECPLLTPLYQAITSRLVTLLKLFFGILLELGLNLLRPKQCVLWCSITDLKLFSKWRPLSIACPTEVTSQSFCSTGCTSPGGMLMSCSF